MTESKLKLRVIKQGTHILPLGKMNDDVPSPCAVVADALADFEYRIGEWIRSGGDDSSTLRRENMFRAVHNSLELLNNALCAATKQGWVLTLEGHPEHSLVQESAMQLCEMMGKKDYKGSSCLIISKPK